MSQKTYLILMIGIFFFLTSVLLVVSFFHSEEKAQQKQLCEKCIESTGSFTECKTFCEENLCKD